MAGTHSADKNHEVEDRNAQRLVWLVDYFAKHNINSQHVPSLITAWVNLTLHEAGSSSSVRTLK